MICSVSGTAPALESLLDAQRIRERIVELGAALEEDYRKTTPLFVAVLRGAAVFHADLIREVHVDLKVDFVTVSSYRGGLEPAAPPQLVSDLESNVAGVDVVLVEDIVDSGRTASFLVSRLRARKPASLRVCSLLSKPSRRQADVQLDYVGFEVPDGFVVGYGLDYQERHRNLPYIAALDPTQRE